MKKPELSSIEITFNLPGWFPPKRLDYTQAYYYPKSHQYAGSYDRSENKNTAQEFFDKTFDYKEACFHPWGSWVTFEVEPDVNSLQTKIDKLQDRLFKFLKRYKEAR